MHSSRRLTLAKDFRVELRARFGLPEPSVQQHNLPPFVVIELHSSRRLTLAKEFRVELCGAAWLLQRNSDLNSAPLCGNVVAFHGRVSVRDAGSVAAESEATKCTAVPRQFS